MQTCFSTTQIRSMKLVPNRVLIKPTLSQNHLSIAGMSLQVDKRFANEKHACVTGTIVNFSPYLFHEKMPWHTQLEIAVGDFCIYSYESAMYAIDPLHGRIFEDEKGEIYYLIDYEDIFTVRRGEQIIPVNGYILVSPVSETLQTNFSIPSHLASSESTRYGIVEYVGTRNECYYAGTKKRTDTYDFKEEVKKGDMVVFSQWSDLPLEFGVHRSLEENKSFFRMQRRDILTIL